MIEAILTQNSKGESDYISKYDNFVKFLNNKKDELKNVIDVDYDKPTRNLQLSNNSLIDNIFKKIGEKTKHDLRDMDNKSPTGAHSSIKFTGYGDDTLCYKLFMITKSPYYIGCGKETYKDRLKYFIQEIIFGLYVNYNKDKPGRPSGLTADIINIYFMCLDRGDFNIFIPVVCYEKVGLPLRTAIEGRDEKTKKIINPLFFKEDIPFRHLITKCVKLCDTLINKYGLLHCDLKPENLRIYCNSIGDKELDMDKIYRGEFTIMVVDFGISGIIRTTNQQFYYTTYRKNVDELVSGVDLLFLFTYLYQYNYYPYRNRISKREIPELIEHCLPDIKTINDMISIRNNPYDITSKIVSMNGISFKTMYGLLQDIKAPTEDLYDGKRPETPLRPIPTITIENTNNNQPGGGDKRKRKTKQRRQHNKRVSKQKRH